MMKVKDRALGRTCQILQCSTPDDSVVVKRDLNAKVGEVLVQGIVEINEGPSVNEIGERLVETGVGGNTFFK